MIVFPFDSGVIPPRKATNDSAGYDLFSQNYEIIPPHDQILIPLKFYIEINPGYYGQISSRSGMALKHRVVVFPGVIDSDYRGEVKVIMINNGDKKYIIKPGARICQLIIVKIYNDELNVGNILDPISQRGDGGFGSSGV